ncbi:MAG: hypothetical protein ABI361_11175 [Nitrososphaera sp.]
MIVLGIFVSLFISPNEVFAQQTPTASSDNHWYVGKGLTAGDFFSYSIIHTHYGSTVSNKTAPLSVANVTMNIYVRDFDNSTHVWTVLINVQDDATKMLLAPGDTLYIADRNMTDVSDPNSPNRNESLDSDYFYRSIGYANEWFGKPGRDLYANTTAGCPHCAFSYAGLGQENVITTAGSFNVNVEKLKAGNETFYAYIDRNLPYPVNGRFTGASACHAATGGGGCGNYDAYEFELLAYGHTLSNLEYPPLAIGNRVFDLEFNASNYNAKSSDDRDSVGVQSDNGLRLIFNLRDLKTNSTAMWVTYVINITRTYDNQSGARFILDDVFLSRAGSLVLDIGRPNPNDVNCLESNRTNAHCGSAELSTKGLALVYAKEDPFNDAFAANYSSEDNQATALPIALKSNELLKPGRYHAEITILTVDYARQLFSDSTAPHFVSDWRVGDSAKIEPVPEFQFAQIGTGVLAVAFGVIIGLGRKPRSFR